MPIINDIGSIKKNPFRKLSIDVRNAIVSASSHLSGSDKDKTLPNTLKLLECLLDLTGTCLSIEDLVTEKFYRIDRIFCGALISTSFIELSTSARYRYISVWKKCLRSLASTYPIDFDNEKPNITLDNVICLKNEGLFDRMEKRDVPYWYWGGGIAKNFYGENTFISMNELYAIHGYQFTNEIYEAYKSSLSSKRARRLVGVEELFHYMSTQYAHYKAEDYKNPELAKSFWFDFRKYFFLVGYNNGAGRKLKTLKNAWSYSLVPFAKDYLSKRGIIAFPSLSTINTTPTFNNSHTPHVKTSKNGIETNYKLTTPIPLSVTDDEAIEIIFSALQNDITTLKKWAKFKTQDLYNRFIQAKLKGIDPEYKDNVNTQFYNQICRVYHQKGYLTDQDTRLITLYPRPLSEIPQTLGIPQSSSLLAYAVLLITEHPEITPDFLRKLELFDKQGNCSALVPQDGHTYLVGYKPRRGAKLAQQKIKLKSETLHLIKQVIQITTPLRDYLKNKQDDNWRMLFLVSGKGFGYPQPVSDFFSGNKEAATSDLQNITGISTEYAIQLKSQLTLSGIRSTMGVLVFLETESLTAASKALGHAKYQKNLMKRYIPKPLLEFFSDRWIRIFQQAIVLHALKDSEFILQASGMHTLDEIHTFLSNHALKLKERSTKTTDVGSDSIAPDKEVVFYIDTNTLTIMLSLIQAAEQKLKQLKPKAAYWSKISQHIVSYIASDECKRPDFKSLLKLAQAKASSRVIEELYL